MLKKSWLCFWQFRKVHAKSIFKRLTYLNVCALLWTNVNAILSNNPVERIMLSSLYFIHDLKLRGILRWKVSLRLLPVVGWYCCPFVSEFLLCVTARHTQHVTQLFLDASSCKWCSYFSVYSHISWTVIFNVQMKISTCIKHKQTWVVEPSSLSLFFKVISHPPTCHVNQYCHFIHFCEKIIIPRRTSKYIKNESVIYHFNAKLTYFQFQPIFKKLIPFCLCIISICVLCLHKCQAYNYGRNSMISDIANYSFAQTTDGVEIYT